MATAPTPRPTQGFSSARAQRWVMAAALIVGMTYALRRIVEPGMAAAPARGSTAHRVAGAGSPPPSLQRWAVAYGTGFTILALVALPAPEVAGSLAVLVVAGTLLANGTSITADLAHLQGTPTPTTATTVDNSPFPADIGPSGPLAGYPDSHPLPNLNPKPASTGPSGPRPLVRPLPFSQALLDAGLTLAEVTSVLHGATHLVDYPH